MSNWLDRLDRGIRRNAALPRARWLRNLLRRPYHALLRASGKGLELSIGGAISVRLPGEYCARELESYEAVSVQAIQAWSSENPGGLFVDIGCSYGYFSCAVLFHDRAAQVLAIDADLPSLAVTRYVCRFAPKVEQRLCLVNALVSPQTSGVGSVESVVRATRERLPDPGLAPDPSKTNYVNLDTTISDEALPRISLDDLLAARLRQGATSCMIKCDVEGAELLVLQGASKTLRVFRPNLLVSVHPPYLPRFGGTVEEIGKLLQQAGYTSKVIDVDHEEHWLCHPN